MGITCLIVNRNCLFHTHNLLMDVKRQTYRNYEVVIVDQGSIETGTQSKLDRWELDGHTVIRNNSNQPLNQIWNDIVGDSNSSIISILNNDIRIPRNFLQDTHDIFAKEENVSCVIHPTNHRNFTKRKKKLDYVVLKERTMQGWDFSIRKSDWIDIPTELEFYCGDDFIFESLYARDKQVAMALSSPIIHLLSQTQKSRLNEELSDAIAEQDVKNYKKLGFSHYLRMSSQYSRARPRKGSCRLLRLRCEMRFFAVWQKIQSYSRVS